MNQVFLDAELCKKIVPYIPAKLLKDWEWWWDKNTSGKWYLVQNTNPHHPIIDAVPALETGILGRIIHNLEWYQLMDDENCTGIRLHEYIDAAVFDKEDSDDIYLDGWQVVEDSPMESETELQTRANALIYLIEHDLIEKEAA